jgi:hypothetical protein
VNAYEDSDGPDREDAVREEIAIGVRDARGWIIDADGTVDVLVDGAR